MASSLRCSALISLLLFVTIHARNSPDSGETFAAPLQGSPGKVMTESDCHASLKTTAIPEAAHSQTRSHAEGLDAESGARAFYGGAERTGRPLVKDFDTEPSITAFYGDGKTKAKSSVKGFDTEPRVTAFHSGAKRTGRSFLKDFDTDPNLSAFYGDGNPKEKSPVKDFDTEPNLSAFYGHVPRRSLAAFSF